MQDSQIQPSQLTIFLEKKTYFSRNGALQFRIALWSKKSQLPFDPYFEVAINNKIVAAPRFSTSSFEVSYKKNFSSIKERGFWTFYKFKVDSQNFAGWQKLEISNRPVEGFTVATSKFRWMIEPFAPEIDIISQPSRKGPDLNCVVSKRQLPAIMQEPLTTLSEIGNKISSSFKKKGINRIIDLLAVDPSTHLIPNVNIHDVPDAVIKAEILSHFHWNNRFERLENYSLNQLVLLTTQSIANRLAVSLKKSATLLNSFRKVHMVMDRSFQEECGLEIFKKHPHSGLERVGAYLNGLDVSDQIDSEKESIRYSPSDLEEGHYHLKMAFYFKSGNFREITHDFTVDTSGPEISLIYPLEGAYLSTSELNLEISLSDKWSSVDKEKTRLFLDGDEIFNFEKSDRIAHHWKNLAEGEHTIQVEAVDTLGNVTLSPLWYLTIDTTNPVVHIKSPLQHITEESHFIIEGTVEEERLETLKVGDEAIPVAEDGSFKKLIHLSDGVNLFSIQARDKAGNQHTSNEIRVIRLGEDDALLEGKVFHPNGEPLAGVKITDIKTKRSTWTNLRGEFLLMDLTEGQLSIEITPQEPENLKSATLTTQVYFGQRNLVQDIYLLPETTPAQIEETSDKRFYTNPDIPDFELAISSDTSLAFLGEEVPISMTLVDTDRLPYEIPGTFPKCKAAVFEPSGMKVTSGTPMSVTMPNDLGLPKGEKVLLIAMDGTSGHMGAAGVAKVSEDESKLVSEEGHGLLHFSVILPLPAGAQIEPYREDKEVALDDAVKGGSKASIRLPGFRLLNRPFDPRLVYSSLAAAPTVHMSAVFRGMKDITTSSRLIDSIHINQEAYAKRVEYFAEYSFWLKGYRDHVGQEYYNEELGDPRYSFVTYLPAEVDAPHLPFPDSMWYGGTFGSQFKFVLENYGKQESITRLYEIDMSLSLMEKYAIWPESITGRYLFSDLETGPFTLLGPDTAIGPKPMPGEEDTRSTFPRLPEDMLLSYHLKPLLPDGSFYPTGLYSWIGSFEVQGRSYRHIQYHERAKKGHFDVSAIEWMIERSEGEKKKELEKLVGVLRKAYTLRRKGPHFESNYSYGGPLDYLMNEQAGQTIIHNLSKSPFGAGWKLEEQHELVPIGRNQVLTIGPEGKQVFTVSNRIQRVGYAYLKYITYSGKQDKIYAISKTGNEWLSKGTTIDLISNIATLFGSAAFSIMYPEKEDLKRVLFKVLKPASVSEELLEQWLTHPKIDYKKTSNGNWDTYPIFKTIYQDGYLRFLITEQYNMALDRPPSDAELTEHFSKLTLDLGDIETFARHPELHYEYLMCIAVDLFFGLKEEMSFGRSNDWIIYIYERTVGASPGHGEIDEIYKRVVGFHGSDDRRLKWGLYSWIYIHYWGPRYFHNLYEEVLGFPPYREHSLRVFSENGEEDLWGVPPFRPPAKYMIRARYRYYRHPTSQNEQTLYMGENVVERFEREEYYNGPSGSRISGMVEREAGELFIADANTHHIYRISLKGYISDPFRFANYGSGSINDVSDRMEVVMGPLDYRYHGGLDQNFTYYDDQDNVINLPEEEAKWIAAYKERIAVSGVTYGIYTVKGFTPDGIYKDQASGNLTRVEIDTPGGLAIDHRNRLCFAETGNHRVRSMDFETGELTTVAGDGRNSGYDPLIRDAKKNAIPEPIDVVINKKKETIFLFHIGQGQQCIGKVDRKGFYSHLGGAPIPGTGTLDTGVDARFFKLRGATSLASGLSGEVFVTIPSQHRVMVVSPDGFIDTVAGNGEAGFPNDDAPALKASLGDPNCIATDKDGNLLINDPANKSLRMVSFNTCGHFSKTEYFPPLGYFQATLTRERSGEWVKKYKNGSKVEFDKQGRNIATADRNGNKTTYKYDGYRLLEVDYPLGAFIKFQYNESGYLTKVVDHLERETLFQMQDGKLSTVEQTDGSKLSLAYDPDGRLLQLKYGDTAEVSYQYNDFGRLISRSVNGRLVEINRPDDLSAGNLDQQNQEALVAYQNYTSVQADGEERIISLEHGRLTEFISSGGNSIKIQYNALRLPERITRPSGSVQIREYNQQGDIIRIEDTFTGKVIESFYNEEGQKILEKNQLGMSSHSEYDSKGNQIASKLEIEGRFYDISKMTYGRRGQLTKKWKKGVESQFDYDRYGNLAEEVKGYLKTKLKRDNSGNITEERNGDLVTTFSYDSMNRLKSSTEGGSEVKYIYDHQANLKQVITEAGVAIEMRYDERNRMVGLDYPNGSRWVFQYDWGDRLVRVLYPDGKELRKEWYSPTMMAQEGKNANHAHTFFEGGDVRSGVHDWGAFVNEIDEVGRKVSQLQIIDDYSFEVLYQFDSLDRLERIKSDGEEVLYEYHPEGQLARIVCDSFEMDFQYDENMRLEQVTGKSAYTSQIHYDTAGRVKSVSTDYETGVSEAWNVQHNGAGYPTRINKGTEELVYTYDQRAQLVTIEVEEVKRVFEYDALGNRVSGPAGAYSYDEAGFLLLSCPTYKYEWDECGRLKEKFSHDNAERHTYEYSVQGQLVRYCRYKGQAENLVLEATYRYDASQRRIAKEVSFPEEPDRNINQRWVYDGHNLLFELNDSGEIVRQYLSGQSMDSWLGFIDGREVYYFQKDRQGSITGVLNTAGERVASYVYDEFGSIISESGELHNDLKYTGRELDKESGLYFYRKRHYDPKLGRFIQPDAYIGTPKEQKSLINRYAYVYNNPLVYRDPSGLHPEAAEENGFSLVDAVVWAGEKVWEFFVWLLSFGKEAEKAHLEPIGSSSKPRSSFDIARAESEILTQSWEAREFMNDIISETIDDLLDEIWGVSEDTFDWKIPDLIDPELEMSLPARDDVGFVDEDLNLLTANNKTPDLSIGKWTQHSNIPTALAIYVSFVDVLDNDGKPSLDGKLKFIINHLGGNQFLVNAQNFAKNNAILVLRSNGKLEKRTLGKVTEKGMAKCIELDPKTFKHTHYTTPSGKKNPIDEFIPDFAHYFYYYFKVLKDLRGFYFFSFQFPDSNSRKEDLILIKSSKPPKKED